MLVVIKKYEFFIRKTNFIKFIIKLGYINIDLKGALAIPGLKRLKLTKKNPKKHLENPLKIYTL